MIQTKYFGLRQLNSYEQVRIHIKIYIAYFIAFYHFSFKCYWCASFEVPNYPGTSLTPSHTCLLIFTHRDRSYTHAFCLTSNIAQCNYEYKKKGLKFCYATTHCFLGKSWMRIWNIFSCWHKFNVIRLFPFEMDTRSGSKMRIRTYFTHNCGITCIIDSKTEHLWSQFLAEHHDYGSVSVKTKVCYCWMPLLVNLFIKFSIVPLLLLFTSCQWILYCRVRVWVQYLSFTGYHRPSPYWWWQTQFHSIYIYSVYIYVLFISKRVWGHYGELISVKTQ